jgi:hypothetical protein
MRAAEQGSEVVDIGDDLTMACMPPSLGLKVTVSPSCTRAAFHTSVLVVWSDEVGVTHSKIPIFMKLN